VFGAVIVELRLTGMSSTSRVLCGNEVGLRYALRLPARMSTKLPILKSIGILSCLSSKVDPYILELAIQHIGRVTSIVNLQ